MVPVSTIICICISLVISFGLPIGLFIYFWKKKKANPVTFLIGCGVFLLFVLILEQIMHSIVLNTTGTSLTDNIWLYGLYGGLAAAVFEETGRLCAMKIFRKKFSKTKANALMYGAGHGGFEAIIIVGLGYISNLVTSFMINSGSMDGIISALPAEQQSAVQSGVDALVTTSSSAFLAAGIERISAIILHICLSVFVYCAVIYGKKIFFGIALLVHFFVDFITVVISGYNDNIWIIEVVVVVLVLITAFVAYNTYEAVGQEVMPEELEEKEQAQEEVPEENQ